ncbi:hypothetical protein [Planctomyces sp. SH-PL62]|uniref:hypothetical protein n=1 Tax=Planctomyces sp. SH-PL62 TaxID=1636152 RepID=UPI00078DA0EA|nr:hypothetical protein [Planctomyces sp. SH-PL62]AMV40553.1 hypothetical protein VT85_24195 [Planctomyces sp. SH-PL62]
MKNRSASASAAMLALATALLLAPLVPGCGGEAEPPPIQADDLEALQKKQQEIIQKEYGPKAGKSGAKKS